MESGKWVTCLLAMLFARFPQTQKCSKHSFICRDVGAKALLHLCSKSRSPALPRSRKSHKEHGKGLSPSFFLCSAELASGDFLGCTTPDFYVTAPGVGESTTLEQGCLHLQPLGTSNPALWERFQYILSCNPYNNPVRKVSVTISI